MLGFGSSKTTRQTALAHAHAASYPKENHRTNRIRGLKAAVNNPRTTSEGRDGAEAQLKHMGVKPNKPTLETRIRHLLGLPGKAHKKRRY